MQETLLPMLFFDDNDNPPPEHDDDNATVKRNEPPRGRRYFDAHERRRAHVGLDLGTGATAIYPSCTLPRTHNNNTSSSMVVPSIVMMTSSCDSMEPTWIQRRYRRPKPMFGPMRRDWDPALQLSFCKYPWPWRNNENNNNNWPAQCRNILTRVP